MHSLRALSFFRRSPVYTSVDGLGKRQRLPWRRLFHSFTALCAVFIVFAGLGFGSSRLLGAKQILVSAAPLPSKPKANPPATTEPLASFATSSSSIYDTQLQAILQQWDLAHPGQKWAVVVRGLGSDDRFAEINSSRTYRTASIYKLLLLYPLFQKYSLNDLKTTYLSAGHKKVSLEKCVDLMLRISDNACGVAVGNRVGWANANAALHKLGLSGTDFNDSENLRTTAADTANYLKALYDGQLFNGSTKNYILNILRQQTWRQGIPAGCQGCVVADKIGDLSYVRHDAGIIQYPSGAYVLSIFTNGASYYQIAQLTTQIQNYMSQ